MRVKAIISYDGGYFKGFQKQTSTNNTITGHIEKALASLGIHDSIKGSGRTDAGVHATGQVIDFKLPPFWKDLEKLKQALNQKLKYISFKHISLVPNDFHARFSAKRRIYRYIFKTSTPSIFEQNHISYYPKFNEKLLIKALNVLEGEHDFSNFIKTGSITHTNVRHIYKAYYKAYYNYHILYFEANGFLRSQVRMMVEAAMLCAKGDLTEEQIIDQINCKQKHTTKLAPPQGLYLARILY